MTPTCQDVPGQNRPTSHESFCLLLESQVENVTMHLSGPEENFCTASPDLSGTTGILKRFQLSIGS